MTIELIKALFDACYEAKRARELMPALPPGVTSSFIQYLDVIEKKEAENQRAKLSDISKKLNIPRPGVTRTVKEMEALGYLEKMTSETDGRITYLAITEKGRELSRIYNQEFFSELSLLTGNMTDEEAENAIQTIHKLYCLMSERRNQK